MNYIQIKAKESNVKIDDLGFSNYQSYSRAFYEGKTQKVVSDTFEISYGSRLRDIIYATSPSTMAASQRFIDIVERYSLKGLSYCAVNVPEICARPPVIASRTTGVESGEPSR